MSEFTLLLFRIGFLVALWVFVFFVVFVVRTDLFGARVKKLPSTQPAQNRQDQVFPRALQAPALGGDAQSRRTSATGLPKQLVITSGTNKGAKLVLGTDAVSIGRSSDSTVVIRDDYTSTHHARIEIKDDVWMVSDMGSTNGTFVNGERITAPVPLHIGSAFTVGATSFEVLG